MPHANKEDRNSTQRAYRARKKLSKSKQAEAKQDRIGKTPFAGFCRIPFGRIEALADDVYQVNIEMGPLTFRYRKYDSNSGQLFMFKRADDTSVLAGAWYASVLRPMIVGAIEEKFDVELPHFDADDEDDDARDVARRWAEQKFVKKWEEAEPIAAVVQAEVPTPADVCRGVLAANPGVTPARFTQLAHGKGIARPVARKWLEEGIAAGTISTEPDEEGALMHTLNRVDGEPTPIDVTKIEPVKVLERRSKPLPLIRIPATADSE